MLFYQILFIIVLTGIAVFLLNVKVIFKKNGEFEKSCTAKHRLLKEKGIDCTNCSHDPLVCKRDDDEHHSFLGHTN
jgi:hypothetical protein